MLASLIQILDNIVAEGKRRGLTQKEICQKAGVSEITISRAKKQGDIRFSTLDKLAKSVGLQLTTSADTPLITLINNGELFQ